jgi:hypothetical protein
VVIIKEFYFLVDEVDVDSLRIAKNLKKPNIIIVMIKYILSRYFLIGTFI